VDEDICIRAVHDAFHAGVNFFDTSPFYGNTKSETVGHIPLISKLSLDPNSSTVTLFSSDSCGGDTLQVLGRALHGLPRSEIVISTKVNQ